MSHQPERKEKNCLNCGVDVLGPYCQNCGQKNVVVHQTFWQLVTHFVYDVLHFDGKFFDTLKSLLFKPGLVPKEYVQGRRFSYLDPIRMYLFTSALFFLVFFSLNNADTGFINMNASEAPLSAGDRAKAEADIKKDLAIKPGDSVLLAHLRRLQDTSKPITATELSSTGGDMTFPGLDSNFKSLQQYDSFQKTLPGKQRDGWVKQKLMARTFSLQTEYGTQPKEGFRQFAELFVHKLPYLLFASLPFFALLLKLLYVRRKTYYYSDHAVFTLYHYIFSFILLLLVFLLSALSGWTQVKLFQKAIPFLLIAWAAYLFIALKRFYGQGWGKTFSKFLLLNVLGIVVLLLLFVLFLFFTFLQL